MSTALATKQGGETGLYAPEAMQATMAMAKALVASRLTPRGVDTPEKAFYIIMKGRELGVAPIRALERIHIIEGKCTMAAELMLERFRQRGGRSKWVTDTNTAQAIHLVAPNGDEHTETFGMEDAARAGLANKDNWKKYPKAMMRARAISAGLRGMGEAEGLYDPDELGAVTSPEGEIVSYQEPAVTSLPKAFTAKSAPASTPSESAPPPSEPGAVPTEMIEMPADEGPRISDENLKRVQAAVSKLDLGKSGADIQGLKGEARNAFIRTARLSYLSWCLGRPVTSTLALTDDEAVKVVKMAGNGEMPND